MRQIAGARRELGAGVVQGNQKHGELQDVMPSTSA